MVEACTHHSTATATATAAPGVVLCVADGIVRIVVHVAAGEDLGGRLRRGIDRLIGVTAGEDKRYDHDRDAEPHGRFPTYWSRPGGRSFARCAGDVGHHALRARGGDLIKQRTLHFNSVRGQEYGNPGNHLSSRGLPGGAEGIRTSNLCSAGTRALDR